MCDIYCMQSSRQLRILTKIESNSAIQKSTNDETASRAHTWLFLFVVKICVNCHVTVRPLAPNPRIQRRTQREERARELEDAGGCAGGRPGGLHHGPPRQAGGSRHQPFTVQNKLHFETLKFGLEAIQCSKT